MGRRIYVASSWRNERYLEVVTTLDKSHEVFDFRSGGGFHWSQIDPRWQSWTPEQFRAYLTHPTALTAFMRDFRAMIRCDTCVLVEPAGRSAHLEAGWFAGRGKDLHVLLDDKEPELMLAMSHGLHVSMDELLEALERPAFSGKNSLVFGASR